MLFLEDQTVALTTASRFAYIILDVTVEHGCTRRSRSLSIPKDVLSYIPLPNKGNATSNKIPADESQYAESKCRWTTAIGLRDAVVCILD